MTLGTPKIRSVISFLMDGVEFWDSHMAMERKCGEVIFGTPKFWDSYMAMRSQVRLEDIRYTRDTISDQFPRGWGRILALAYGHASANAAR